MLGKIIGIIGALGVGVSTLLDWGKLVFIRGEEVSIKKFGGIDELQGQIAIGAAVLALVLLFVKPKLAIIPALISIGASVWYYIVELSGTPKKPGMGLWIAIGCAVLVAVGGYMIPARKK